MFTNVLNRLVRSCFYTSQKYYDGLLPYGIVEDDILKEAKETILTYELAMYKTDLHNIANILDTYIRQANKYWVKNITQADKEDNDVLRKQVLINAFHMVRVACLLSHPIAPVGTEMVLDYLNLAPTFWSWDNVFADIYQFSDNPQAHKLKFLEPKIDFFEKHPSQFL